MSTNIKWFLNFFNINPFCLYALIVLRKLPCEYVYWAVEGVVIPWDLAVSSIVCSMDSSTGAFSSYSLDSGMYSLNVSVSDGRFTSYGVIGVKVVSITDEMMADSVGVLIGGITSRDFISLHRRAFEKALLELSSEFRYVYYLRVTSCL